MSRFELEAVRCYAPSAFGRDCNARGLEFESGTKKQKAENILTKAYGINGPKEFEHAILFKANTIQIFQEQTENDYLSVKKLAAQDGEPNFTRKQYCKMLDDAADFAVDEDFKKFKLMVPNF